MTEYYDLYRYTHPDGTTKDWAVRSNSDGTYTSRWGKTGAKLQSKTFPGSVSMHKHIREKTRKGYLLIGSVRLDEHGYIANSPAISKAPGTPPVDQEPCIYWRIKAHPCDAQVIEAFKLSIDTLCQTLAGRFPDCAWLPLFSRQCLNDQTSSGKLVKANGVAALLLLMAMMKTAPHPVVISLAHDDAVEISSQLRLEFNALAIFDTNFEAVRSIAEEIGLIVKKLDLSKIASAQESFYF